MGGRSETTICLLSVLHPCTYFIITAAVVSLCFAISAGRFESSYKRKSFSILTRADISDRVLAYFIEIFSMDFVARINEKRRDLQCGLDCVRHWYTTSLSGSLVSLYYIPTMNRESQHQPQLLFIRSQSRLITAIATDGEKL